MNKQYRKSATEAFKALREMRDGPFAKLLIEGIDSLIELYRDDLESSPPEELPAIRAYIAQLRTLKQTLLTDANPIPKI